jgi:hypothetical protein
MGERPAAEKPMIEYCFTGGGVFDEPLGIRLYEDGRVEQGCTEDGRVVFQRDGKTRGFRITPDQVKQYAESLVKAGFFELNVNNSLACLGGECGELTLNYKNMSKNVSWNIACPYAVNEITRELRSLAVQKCA